MRAGKFVEAGHYNNNYYGTSVTGVTQVASEVCKPPTHAHFMVTTDREKGARVYS